MADNCLQSDVNGGKAVPKQRSLGGPPTIARRNVDALRDAFERGYLKAFRDTIVEPNKFDGAQIEDLILIARECAIRAFPE